MGVGRLFPLSTQEDIMNRYKYTHQKIKPTIRWFEKGDVWRDKKTHNIIVISSNSKWQSTRIRYVHQMLNDPKLEVVLSINDLLDSYEQI